MIKNKINKTLALFSSGVILAQTPPRVSDITNLPTGNFGSAQALVVGIINWLLILVSAFAVFAIIYSGLMYIMSSSDQAKAETAKKNLLWAITGLGICILALFLVNVLQRFLSTNP